MASATAGYKARHNRKVKAHGPARLQQCYRCDSQALDWATLHYETGFDLNDYVPLCRRCHLRYDRDARPRHGAPRKLSAEQVRGIRADVRLADAVASEYGVSGAAIRKIRRGVTYQDVVG